MPQTIAKLTNIEEFFFYNNPVNNNQPKWLVEWLANYKILYDY